MKEQTSRTKILIEYFVWFTLATAIILPIVAPSEQPGGFPKLNWPFKGKK